MGNLISVKHIQKPPLSSLYYWVLWANCDSWSWHKAILPLVGNNDHLALLEPTPGGEAKVLEEDQEQKNLKKKSPKPWHFHTETLQPILSCFRAHFSLGPFTLSCTSPLLDFLSCHTRFSTHRVVNNY